MGGVGRGWPGRPTTPSPPGVTKQWPEWTAWQPNGGLCGTLTGPPYPTPKGLSGHRALSPPPPSSSTPHLEPEEPGSRGPGCPAAECGCLKSYCWRLVPGQGSEHPGAWLFYGRIPLSIRYNGGHMTQLSQHMRPAQVVPGSNPRWRIDTPCPSPEGGVCCDTCNNNSIFFVIYTPSRPKKITHICCKKELKLHDLAISLYTSYINYLRVSASRKDPMTLCRCLGIARGFCLCLYPFPSLTSDGPLVANVLPENSGISWASGTEVRGQKWALRMRVEMVHCPEAPLEGAEGPPPLCARTPVCTPGRINRPLALTFSECRFFFLQFALRPLLLCRAVEERVPLNSLHVRG